MMHYIILLLFSILLLNPSDNADKGWTDEEIASANTAKHAAYLNDVEKETLLYINLVRLYPKKYAALEVPKNILIAKAQKAEWHSYRKSLLKDLNGAQPLQPLLPDSAMTANAKCYAKEMGESGKYGHKRERCKKENFAECCSYGLDTGRDIVLQFLIDYQVQNLGHRKDLLTAYYKKAGLGFDKHIKSDHCLVLVLR
jgi:uncharacterized protein YkwD